MNFFKIVFASMVGYLFAAILILLISFIVLIGIVKSAERSATIKDKSVLELNFDYVIKERTSKNPLDNLFEGKPGPGLNDILKSIKKAKEDDKIKGVLINTDRMPAGLATTQAIRDALMDFKTSEKFIYAYGEDYNQGTYYLASVADKIYLHPEGSFDMRGLRIQMMFFKKLLGKLDVEPQVIRHGKFKSAAEPFVNEKMSDENRQQIRELINSVWDHYVSVIAASRNVAAEEIKAIAAELKIRTPQDALQHKMVDEIAYYDQVLDEIKSQTGLKEKEKVRLVNLKKYGRGKGDKSATTGRGKIAMVYAVGAIEGGDGDDQTIGSDRISAAVRKARLDTTIKAIVLRVNSPGGSAIASDVIWREVVLAKKVKPVVVSMSDLAASGGYYISCGADKIVAEPTTLTGSIGVIGLIMNMQKMFDNKLGITFDTVKTGRFADLLSVTRPLTAEEREIIQQEIERIYNTFITHVSEGRGMSKELVDSLGQGRLWSGVDALRLGLVDTLGGVSTAVEIAAGLAGLEKYRVVELPEQKDLFQQLLEDYSASAQTKIAEKHLGEYYSYLRQMKSALSQTGILMRMEVEIEIY